MKYDYSWVSEYYGFELRMKSSKRGIRALKRFLDILESDTENEEPCRE